MENLIYLAKVNLYWTISYTCFWLLFRKHTFFALNRYYLLGTLFISLFLPLITISKTAAVKIPDVVYSISVDPVVQTENQISNQNINWTPIIFLVYIIGITIMSFNLFKGFYNLFSLIRKGEAIKFENHTLILLPENVAEKGKIGSFSFFKWLVISYDDYGNCLENVLRHEMVHISQRHSVDILIVEFLKTICWFNPVLWLYKISMQQIHEFLADASAPDREDYATFLISYSFNAPVQSLSNPFFNSSLLKSRIKMIFQNRSPRWLLSKYMMILPVLGLVVILTAAREQLTKISDFGTKMIENSSSQYVGNSTENQEQSNLSLTAKIDKKAKPIKNDSVPGKLVLDRNAYFQNSFRWTENYFYSQIKYPIEALVANIQGQVRVSFTVDENGDIRDAKIVEGLGYGIDEEALRVIQNMPKWHSAIKNGKPIAVRITMGIDFYPALAGGRRKSDIEIRKEYYNVAPKVAALDIPFQTISEIGKFFNKSLDFSDANPPTAKLFRYGYTMSGWAFLPPIQITNDSVEVKR
ncbi:M56 family metallopeptidase [Dyadobacter frigoris]|uniref:M56 family metallopeptidase n=1 Tax=Dyadobacter frigoris TaxID=2576211 RepID=A0A4V6Y1W6_9BACT|nr:M56 family metallopeptidase [Dyadobacter frigoris]TKT89403.1 M56 family metallopeptidase [Dyadobacter frigoris]GLU55457.1 cell envelope biogenesis protein TonB [Dyadobacter frigoris]